MKNRPKLRKVSEQMKEWSTLLGNELQTWSRMRSRRMFGMTVFYRSGVIFAALPRTMGFEMPNSVAFKLHKTSLGTTKLLDSDPRIMFPSDRETGWISFEIEHSGDLSGALEWFMRAFKSCGRTRNSKERENA